MAPSSQAANGHRSLSEIRLAAGFRTANALATASKVSGMFVIKLEKGRIAPNHPFLPFVARPLGLSHVDVAKFCKAKEMDGQQVKRLLHRRRNHAATSAGTSLMVVPRGKGAIRRPLKKVDKDIVQTLRSLAIQINVELMKGKTHISIEAIPARALGRMLADYLKLRGVTVPVILDANFDEIFA